jgi:glycerophosphoryl diester phosphodiesterase
MDPRLTATLTGLAVFVTAALLLPTAAAQSRKQNIAHRGASAYAPEHTAAAYRLAIEQGADFVEQDLAVTRDGQLICLHDDTLSRTTDAEALFPDRFVLESGPRGTSRRWYANDFTLAEIRRLDAGRWFDESFAGARIQTWDEAVDLVRGKAGLYPELKSPPLYVSRGVDMVGLFVASVKAKGLDRPESLRETPLIVQSFDEPTIRRLATELPGVPRVLLMGSLPDGGLTDQRLTDLATFATGIGPAKNLVAQDPALVRRAHAAGLTVTAYTFGSRGPGEPGAVRGELRQFLNDYGIDAAFTNNPDLFPRD